MATREERELQDVERSMEEELVAEHMQVERVIHLRLEQASGQQQLKYLVKVCVQSLCSLHFMNDEDLGSCCVCTRDPQRHSTGLPPQQAAMSVLLLQHRSGDQCIAAAGEMP